jgi:hypothetical protein
MAGAGDLPLVVSPTIANVQLRHVLIDGGAGLSILSTSAFFRMELRGVMLHPAEPFAGVGPGAVTPLGSVSLPVTFGTSNNFRTEYVDFTVADLHLPYNAILGRPMLHKFMAAAHYGYLCLKIPGPKGPITVHADRSAAASAVCKMYSIAANGFKSVEEQEEPLVARAQLAPGVVVSEDPLDLIREPGPSTSTAPGKKIARPVSGDTVPAKTIQIGANSFQTTRVGGGLTEK